MPAEGTDLPVFHDLPGGGISVHGTSVALEGRGLLILGSSGAGKSSLAAHLIALGARLVADDLTLIRPVPDRAELGLWRREDGPKALELRGLGLCHPPVCDTAPLMGVLLLAPSAARLPEQEILTLCGRPVPLWRHPYGFDLAAKLWLWARERRE